MTARQSFRKIRPDEALVDTMVAAIGRWKKSEQWSRDGGQFIPHPSTWLNQRRWEDELPKPAAPVMPQRQAVVAAQQYEQRDYSGVQDEYMERYSREIEEKIRRKQEAMRSGGVST